MSLLPSLTAKELVAALHRAGFEPVRQTGSHIILRHTDGRGTVIPSHQGEDVDPRLVLSILRQVGISQTDFRKLLK